MPDSSGFPLTTYILQLITLTGYATDVYEVRVAFGWLGPNSLMRLAYLVDPASSHMLVSKVKPCMPKFPLDLLVKPRTAH